VHDIVAEIKEKLIFFCLFILNRVSSYKNSLKAIRDVKKNSIIKRKIPFITVMGKY